MGARPKHATGPQHVIHGGLVRSTRPDVMVVSSEARHRTVESSEARHRTVEPSEVLHRLRWSCKNEEISWSNNVSLLRLSSSNARKLWQLSNSNVKMLWRLSCVRKQLSNRNVRMSNSDVERILSNRNESVRSFSIRS